MDSYLYTFVALCSVRVVWCKTTNMNNNVIEFDPILFTGNVLVILVIIFNTDIHDAYYYFIASYASSDILTAFTYTPG